jgi:hypothetical protein
MSDKNEFLLSGNLFGIPVPQALKVVPEARSLHSKGGNLFFPTVYGKSKNNLY